MTNTFFHHVPNFHIRRLCRKGGRGWSSQETMPSVRGSFGCYETVSGSRELRKTECSSAKECAHIREKSVWMCGVGRAILCQCCVLLAFCSPASPAAYHFAAAPPSLHQAFSTKRFPVPPLLPLPISLQFHLGSPRSAVAVLFLGNEACLSFAADHVLSFSSSEGRCARRQTLLRSGTD